MRKTSIKSNLYGIYKKIKLHLVRLRHPSKEHVIDIEPVSRQFGMDRGTPIDRYYISSFLTDNRHFIKGDLLEVAEYKYSREFSFGNSNFNILSYGGEGEIDGTDVNIIRGDLVNYESLPEGFIDCFICTQTLNFIYDIKEAVHGIYKILKDGGCALVTVSAISQISRYDYDRWGDYWRFTDKGIKKLFEDVFGSSEVDVQTYGNLAAAIAELKGMAIEDLIDKSILDKSDTDYPCIIGVVAKKRRKKIAE